MANDNSIKAIYPEKNAKRRIMNKYASFTARWTVYIFFH